MDFKKIDKLSSEAAPSYTRGENQFTTKEYAGYSGISEATARRKLSILLSLGKVKKASFMNLISDGRWMRTSGWQLVESGTHGGKK